MNNPTLFRFLKPLNIQTVVDVGASDGRFSKWLWPEFPEAEYILIDPLEYPDKWEGHKISWVHKCLHYEEDGFVKFTKTDDPFQSGAYGQGTVEVPTTTLSKICQGKKSIFLKLDTHGVEFEILNNQLRKLRSRIPAVQIEVYNFPLSSTSLPFQEMVVAMGRWGYRVATLLDALYRGDGCLWQMDLLFLHKENPVFNRPDFFYS
jgi:FkbM family methyltransferase